MTSPTAFDATARAALDHALDYVRSWVEYRAWRLRVPGVQYAVWYDGGLRLSGAVGFADVEAGVALTPAHRFRIASHSKTFTATAVLQLAERGALRLDDTVAAFVPELADAPSGIGEVTVRELLEHGGGVLRDGLDGDYWQHARPFPDEEELIAMVRADGVKTDRNASFNYSNLGYSLLGMIVARASGTDYRSYVTAHIIRPLGLDGTQPDLDPDADYAVGYSGLHVAPARVPIPHVDTHAMSSATGFASTAEDVVRYLAAHRIGSGELLDDGSKRLQQRMLWESEPGSGRGYGLGMIIEKVAGRRVIGHSGGYPGHITRTLLDPADGIAVSVLTNAIDGPAGELSSGILTILDAALETPGHRTAAAPKPLPDDTSSFEGRFAAPWGVLDVVRLGDRLLAVSPVGPEPLAGKDELEVVDDDTLRIASGDGFGSIGELIHYTRDAAGETVRVRGSGGMTMWAFDPARAEGEVPWGTLG
ncbi:MAG: beta-lactamase family protein [Microbacterium sp.]|uniref:serine hydrolase domain-containing protein n=1 Tax=Microbacterium sp. TaxID=51671 RepID=UPI001AC2F922|nr:serine hydrolase domain-containing protein [Microbacterium sp.]MBN9154668.1 beta-lactamase family protein [Microbacterium sp.]